MFFSNWLPIAAGPTSKRRPRHRPEFRNLFRKSLCGNVRLWGSTRRRLFLKFNPDLEKTDIHRKQNVLRHSSHDSVDGKSGFRRFSSRLLSAGVNSECLHHWIGNRLFMFNTFFGCFLMNCYLQKVLFLLKNLQSVISTFLSKQLKLIYFF